MIFKYVFQQWQTYFVPVDVFSSGNQIVTAVLRDVLSTGKPTNLPSF